LHSIEVVNDILMRRVGNADAGKLLCLHGFADNGLAFLPLSGTALPGYFELVLVDLPGFGGSPSKPGVALIRDYGKAIAELGSIISPREPVGLVGHSIASAIAVDAAELLSSPPIGVFSIEGNLTEDDAYFTGRAADWDEAEAFKKAFLNEIWELAATNVELRRYFGGVVMAQAPAMWSLGRDAKRVSVGDAVGHAYRALKVPNLYYWSEATTPARTRQFIGAHSIPNRRYAAASHWPTIADPEATANAIVEFFLSAAEGGASADPKSGAAEL
jgi:pimeloyl-ACP methyl ester carboxylesterase